MAELLRNLSLYRVCELWHRSSIQSAGNRHTGDYYKERQPMSSTTPVKYSRFRRFGHPGPELLDRPRRKAGPRHRRRLHQDCRRPAEHDARRRPRRRCGGVCERCARRSPPTPPSSRCWTPVARSSTPCTSPKDGFTAMPRGHAARQRLERPAVFGRADGAPAAQRIRRYRGPQARTAAGRPASGWACR